MFIRRLFVLLLARAACIAAHGGLANYTVGDTWYPGYDPFRPASEQLGQAWLTQRSWTSIDPLFSATSASLACNAPGLAPPSSIRLRAGDVLTAVYYYWLHPVGPMSVWLARCPSGACADARPDALRFFKIWHAGLLDGTVPEGTWYQKAFQRWDGDGAARWPVALPPALAPGAYVVRHEIVSLHVARRPQFYVQCAHLDVAGGGTARPGPEYEVRFPGAYRDDDPSIDIDIYSEAMRNATNYTIPGPPVWEG